MASRTDRHTTPYDAAPAYAEAEAAPTDATWSDDKSTPDREVPLAPDAPATAPIERRARTSRSFSAEVPPEARLLAALGEIVDRRTGRAPATAPVEKRRLSRREVITIVVIGVDLGLALALARALTVTEGSGVFRFEPIVAMLWKVVPVLLGVSAVAFLDWIRGGLHAVARRRTTTAVSVALLPLLWLAGTVSVDLPIEVPIGVPVLIDGQRRVPRPIRGLPAIRVGLIRPHELGMDQRDHGDTLTFPLRWQRLALAAVGSVPGLHAVWQRAGVIVEPLLPFVIEAPACTRVVEVVGEFGDLFFDKYDEFGDAGEREGRRFILLEPPDPLEGDDWYWLPQSDRPYAFRALGDGGESTLPLEIRVVGDSTVVRLAGLDCAATSSVRTSR